MRATSEQQQVVLHGDLLHLGGKFTVGRFIIAEFRRHHRAQPAHFADFGRIQIAQKISEPRTQSLRALEQLFLFNHIQHRHRRGHAQRVAGISAAEAAFARRIHDFRLAGHTAQHKAAGHAFGHGDDVGLHIIVLHRKQFAGAAEAGLHFVGNHHNAVFIANFAHRTHKFGRAHIKAALALHRLQNNRRHIGGQNIAFENAFDAFHRIGHADVLRVGRIKRVKHTGRHGAEIGLIRQHLAGECQRHHGAAVKSAAKGNHAVAARGRAGDFHRVFHRLGAAGEELAFHFAANRHQLVDALGQQHIAFIRHHLKSGVGEFFQLRRHSSSHFRVAVAGVQHADAAGKINDLAAVCGGDGGVFGTLGKPVAHHAGAVGQSLTHTGNQIAHGTSFQSGQSE